jgi:hypothetical protein
MVGSTFFPQDLTKHCCFDLCIIEWAGDSKHDRKENWSMFLFKYRPPYFSHCRRIKGSLQAAETDFIMSTRPIITLVSTCSKDEWADTSNGIVPTEISDWTFWGKHGTSWTSHLSFDQSCTSSLIEEWIL